MSYEIRELLNPTDEEIKLFSSIEEECFDEDEAFSAEDMPTLVRGSQIKLLIYEHGNLCGYLLGRYAFGTAYLYSIAVLPFHQGKGVGRALFEQMKHYLFSLGCKVIISHCGVENATSEKMHLAFGFTPVEYEPDFYGDNKDAVSWRLEL